jgi:hypothetical protein
MLVVVGRFPSDFDVADLNGDSQADIIADNSDSNTITVLLGTGAGRLSAATAYSTGIRSVPTNIAVAEVNGDGSPDLLVANINSNTTGLLLYMGSGSFQSIVTYDIGLVSSPHKVVVSDVNGDSKPNLLTSNAGLSRVGVLLGMGNSSFGVTTSYDAGISDQPSDLAVTDVNGDGKLDLVYS